MSSTMDRRSFLGRGALAAGGGLLAAGAMQGLVARQALGAPGRGRGPAGRGDGGYGELVPAGPELALPRGFTYRMFGVEGTPMSDGNLTPRAHDGMGALALPNGNVRLIRNHEEPRPGRALEPDRRPGPRLRPARRRRQHLARGAPGRRARAGAGLRQPERHDRELRRRQHALGLVAEPRGEHRG